MKGRSSLLRDLSQNSVTIVTYVTAVSGAELPGVTSNICGKLIDLLCQMILCNLAVHRHSGPMQSLSGLALVPVSREQGRQQLLLFARCFVVGPITPDLEVMRKIGERDTPGRAIEENCFDKIFQLADISGPVVP